MNDRRRESLERRMDTRFDGVDRRLDSIDSRVENKLERHVRWTIGIQVTMFALIVGGLDAMLTR